MYSYKMNISLNPGHPSTKEYLMKLVREVVTVMIDGVHFDTVTPKCPFSDSYDFRRWQRQTLDDGVDNR